MPLDNFGSVTDKGHYVLYRSAQPDWWGYEDLVLMGVKTIVQLNAGDFGLGEMVHGELDFIRHKMEVRKPYDFEVRRIVDQIEEALAKGSVLVHCMYGRDRTGVIIAAYRIIKEGWTYEEAYDEMEKYSGGRPGKRAYFDPDFTDYLENLGNKERLEQSASAGPASEGSELGAFVPTLA